MDAQTVIAKRIALELRDGMLVNLGIGIPTLVANFVPPGIHVFFQSENGLIGTGPIAEAAMAQPRLTDAGGRPVTAVPGACTFDSAMSFALIRGGHVDVTVLGGLQVDQRGLLANWMIPGKMVPGMGGAMDLVSGAKRVLVAMQHTAKGKSKIVKRVSLPLTSVRPVDLVVTELAVIGFPKGRAHAARNGAGRNGGPSARRHRGRTRCAPRCNDAHRMMSARKEERTTMRLKEKSAIITGAASGIGKAIARPLRPRRGQGSHRRPQQGGRGRHGEGDSRGQGNRHRPGHGRLRREGRQRRRGAVGRRDLAAWTSWSATPAFRSCTRLRSFPSPSGRKCWRSIWTALPDNEGLPAAHVPVRPRRQCHLHGLRAFQGSLAAQGPLRDGEARADRPVQGRRQGGSQRTASVPT